MFCKSCGKEISDQAVVCPGCGVAVKGAAGSKSKIAAGLLAIFLGAFGVHNFYLGYTGKAIAQLLITVLTCGFGAFISGIWSLIEGILILVGNISVDAKGNPLVD